MAHFYFHVRTGGRLIVDRDGGDLPDLDAARAVAVAALRHHDAAAAAVPHEAIGAAADRRFEIMDGRGRLLTTVRVGDAVGSH